jgi:hypothetical protein
MDQRVKDDDIVLSWNTASKAKIGIVGRVEEQGCRSAEGLCAALLQLCVRMPVNRDSRTSTAKDFVRFCHVKASQNKIAQFGGVCETKIITGYEVDATVLCP